MRSSGAERVAARANPASGAKRSPEQRSFGRDLHPYSAAPARTGQQLGGWECLLWPVTGVDFRVPFCPLRFPSNRIHPFHRVGSPGASVKETEILTGVLEATVRDPSRSGPGAKLMCGLTRPKETSASAGDPTPFSRPRGVPRKGYGAHVKMRAKFDSRSSYSTFVPLFGPNERRSLLTGRG